MAVPRGARVGMMVVVPAFAGAEISDEQIVAARLVGFVISITPYMCHRIDRPGVVPDQHRAHENAPDQQAQAELQRLHGGAAEQQFGNEPAGKKDQPRSRDDAKPRTLALDNDINAVSYTHLRAHETDSYLVCRLL